MARQAHTNATPDKSGTPHPVTDATVAPQPAPVLDSQPVEVLMRCGMCEHTFRASPLIRTSGSPANCPACGSDETEPCEVGADSRPVSWYVGKTSGGQGLIIDEKDGYNIAVAYDAKNAPLIAAAPEMLALLKRVECFLGALHEDAVEVFGSLGKEPISIVDIRDKARAAIANAKGEA